MLELYIRKILLFLKNKKTSVICGQFLLQWSVLLDIFLLLCYRAAVSNILGTGFVEGNFSTNHGSGDGFRMIQVQYIHHALYF